MMGETEQKHLKYWQLASAVAALVGAALGCAKTDVQAPPKEAPTAHAAAPEPHAPNEDTNVSPAPSAASDDRWPQAEPKPGSGSPESPPAAAPVGVPARQSSDSQKKKEAARPSSAAKGELGASEGRARDAEEAAPALAVSQSWTQLNLAFDGLSSALALTVPDCVAADRFRQNVCSLAERICTLERDLPSTTPHNCSDGRARCSEASSRYHSKCER